MSSVLLAFVVWLLAVNRFDAWLVLATTKNPGRTESKFVEPKQDTPQTPENSGDGGAGIFGAIGSIIGGLF